MTNDVDDVINFGENKVLREQKHIAIKPGSQSYTLTSEGEYDLVCAINGRGTVVWDGKQQDLHKGGRVTIEHGKSYSVESASNEELTVTIYSLDANTN